MTNCLPVFVCVYPCYFKKRMLHQFHLIIWQFQLKKCKHIFSKSCVCVWLCVCVCKCHVGLCIRKREGKKNIVILPFPSSFIMIVIIILISIIIIMIAGIIYCQSKWCENIQWRASVCVSGRSLSHPWGSMQSSTSLMDNTARKDPDSTQVCVRALGVFAGTCVLLCI